MLRVGPGEVHGSGVREVRAGEDRVEACLAVHALARPARVQAGPGAATTARAFAELRAALEHDRLGTPTG
jgi:hypothetical protein